MDDAPRLTGNQNLSELLDEAPGALVELEHERRWMEVRTGRDDDAVGDVIPDLADVPLEPDADGTARQEATDRGGVGSDAVVERDAIDEIRLEVPTTPDLLRLVRVVASGLASRLGFPIDAVEDVRLAVDELCWTVAGRAGPTATLAVRFAILEAAFSVEARLRPGLDAVPDASLSALSQRILETLVEDYTLLDPGDGQGSGFRMRTKHS